MKRGVLNVLIFSVVLYIFFITSIFRNKNKSYQNCLKYGLTRRDEKSNWYFLPDIVEECVSLLHLHNISHIDNKDERKYFVMPDLKKHSSLTLVTLGVGQDIGAELHLHKLWPKNLYFVAADPIEEGNKELVGSIKGKFFPYAVRSEAGTFEASVLPFGATKPPPAVTKDEKIGDIVGNRTEYIQRPVLHIGFLDFLTNYVGKSLIHMLWIDIEGAEYSILPLISSDAFSHHGITVCQINIEIHRPNTTQKLEIGSFLKDISQPDSRFSIVRVVRGFHLRLFLVNIEDNRC